MALTMQRKLELTDDLAKVQSLLQWLRLLEKPKKRRGVRDLILVSSVIGGIVAAVAVIAALRRRGRRSDAVAGDNDSSQADSPNAEVVPTTNEEALPTTG